MSNVIKKTADKHGIFQYVEMCNLADYPSTDWLHDPDISAVSAVLRDHWKVSGSTVIEMSQIEKDAVDAAMLISTNIEDANTTINVDNSTYAPGETKIHTIPIIMTNMIINVSNPAAQGLLNEQLLSPAGVGWDPINKSSNMDNINDGVYTNLAYNNTSVGNTTGFILGIDLGTPTTINAMKMWDYTASYYNTSWEFIGTDDATATTYNVIFTHNQSSPYLYPEQLLKTFSDVTYRYYGVRCVTSLNASYSIVAELELCHGTLTTYERALIQDVDYTVLILPDNTISVTNEAVTTEQLKLVIIGK